MLKHAPKGATEATRVMFLPAASLTYADVNALYIDVSNTVYGFTVLILVPPTPVVPSIFKSVALIGTVFSSILIAVTPMKYSEDFSPDGNADAVLTGLMSNGVVATVEIGIPGRNT